MGSFWNGILIGILAGVIAGVPMALIIKRKKISGVAAYNNQDEKEKEARLEKIKGYIADKDKFTNDDLEKLLGVSNTTIGRYLDELEQEGQIVQHGATGKYVYYTKK